MIQRNFSQSQTQQISQKTRPNQLPYPTPPKKQPQKHINSKPPWAASILLAPWLNEAIEAASMSQFAGWGVMVSHRSGETEDR